MGLPDVNDNAEMLVTPGRSRLVMPYYAGHKGLRVANTFDLVMEGPEFGFHVQVEDEVFWVRTICGYNLLYVDPAQKGTQAADHAEGAEVRRLR